MDVEIVARTARVSNYTLPTLIVFGKSAHPRPRAQGLPSSSYPTPVAKILLHVETLVRSFLASTKVYPVIGTRHSACHTVKSFVAELQHINRPRGCLNIKIERGRATTGFGLLKLGRRIRRRARSEPLTALHL